MSKVSGVALETTTIPEEVAGDLTVLAKAAQAYWDWCGSGESLADLPLLLARMYLAILEMPAPMTPQPSISFDDASQIGAAMHRNLMNLTHQHSVYLCLMHPGLEEITPCLMTNELLCLARIARQGLLVLQDGNAFGANLFWHAAFHQQLAMITRLQWMLATYNRELPLETCEAIDSALPGLLAG